MTQDRFIYSLVLAGFVLSKGAAQANFVPNPSFEEIVNCPADEGQFYLAGPWFSATTAGTPDLFNSCSVDKGHSVPYNGQAGLSYQPSRTGNGYAGIFNYSHHSNTETREYIEVPLLERLKRNKQYYIRFFISPSNSVLDDAPCYCDGIGAAFAEEKIISSINGLHVLSGLQPVVDKKGAVMSDTVNWIPVSGCFTNTNSEKNYLIIGNFRDNAHTIASPECDLSFSNTSYLYVEDVGVWEFDPLPDTLLLCNGEHKTVQVSFLEASYQWSDGTTDSTYTIAREGVYSVFANMGDCILKDSVVVIEAEKQGRLLPDTLICLGDKVHLTAPLPGVYEWSTGATTSGIDVLEAGLYTLTIANECGNFIYESNIETELCDCPIYIPNVFSPNGDGVNDELLVSASCDFPLYNAGFQIYDRWGTLVYTSNTDDLEAIRWDGAFRGAPASTGVYTWILEYTIAPKNRPEHKILRGDVTVLR